MEEIMGLEDMIILRGKINKEPRFNEDGTVDLVLTNRKTKKMGVSNFVIRLTEEQYKSQVQPRIQSDTEICFQGLVKAAVTKKGIPYILVSCSNILTSKADKSSIDKEVEMSKPKRQKENTFKEKSRQSKNKWYKMVEEDEFINIEVSKIKLVDPIHMKLCNLNINLLGNDINKPVAVRENEEGIYELIVGVKSYIKAKILDIGMIKAYKTDLGREDFIREFKIVERLDETKNTR